MALIYHFTRLRFGQLHLLYPQFQCSHNLNASASKFANQKPFATRYSPRLEADVAANRWRFISATSERLPPLVDVWFPHMYGEYINASIRTNISHNSSVIVRWTLCRRRGSRRQIKFWFSIHRQLNQFLLWHRFVNVLVHTIDEFDRRAFDCKFKEQY